MKLYLALLSLVVAMSAMMNAPPARAATSSEMVSEWFAPNDACRARRSAKTKAACARREALSVELAERGWCYRAPPSQPRARTKQWLPCVGNEAVKARVPEVLLCDGKTVVFEPVVAGTEPTVKSTTTWRNEILLIDVDKKTVRHNEEASGPALTSVTRTHYAWKQEDTLTTEGSFNRISGTGEERVTLAGQPDFLVMKYFEHCERAPKPKF
jgi:hypothetical protein